MKTIKVGMIGAGQIAYDHCSGINSHPMAEVVAVADPSEKRARALGGKFGVGRVYETAAELIADADIAAVSVAVPNVYHAQIAIAALKAGKHVLLDKPFAMNYKQAAAVADAAKAAQRVFMLGMNWRYTTDVQTIKVLADRGELGDIYHAKTCILRRSGCPRFGTWFCQKKMAGGGALLDIGVHFLDACLYLMANFNPVAVSGAVYTKFGNRGIGEGTWGMSDKGKQVFDVDDFATALIKFKNGATVQLDASWALHMENSGRMAIELFGTEAGASISPPKIFRYGKERGAYEVVEHQGVELPYPHGSRFHNWIDVILRKARPCCAIKEALAVQKTLDAIYESARSGREIRVG